MIQFLQKDISLVPDNISFYLVVAQNFSCYFYFSLTINTLLSYNEKTFSLYITRN